MFLYARNPINKPRRDYLPPRFTRTSPVGHQQLQLLGLLFSI